MRAAVVLVAAVAAVLLLRAEVVAAVPAVEPGRDPVEDDGVAGAHRGRHALRRHRQGRQDDQAHHRDPGDRGHCHQQAAGPHPA